MVCNENDDDVDDSDGPWF